MKDALQRSDYDTIFYYNDEPGFRSALDYDHVPEIYFGHFIHGAHAKVGQPERYACFLRSPAERMISHFYHLRNHDFSIIGDMVREYETAEAAALGMRYWEFDNFLCRVLSGAANTVAFGNVGFQVYEAALKNLRNFQFIGLFEEMERSMQLLHGLLPKLGNTLERVNVGEYDRKSLPEEALRAIRPFNAYDSLLYEKAVELFRQQDLALTQDEQNKVGYE